MFQGIQITSEATAFRGDGFETGDDVKRANACSS